MPAENGPLDVAVNHDGLLAMSFEIDFERGDLDPPMRLADPDPPDRPWNLRPWRHGDLLQVTVPEGDEIAVSDVLRLDASYDALLATMLEC